MKTVRFICSFYIFIAMVACTGPHNPKTLVDYKAWFNDETNGFLKVRTLGNLEYVVQYRPADLMALNEAIEDFSKLDSIKNTYGKSKYFLLVVRPKDKPENAGNLLAAASQTMEDYGKLVKEMAFRMNENIRLVSGKDTLEPVLFHYEQGYDLSSEQRFIFAFNPTESSKDENNFVFYYDDHLFGNGRIKFAFNIDKSIPVIPINSI